MHSKAYPSSRHQRRSVWLDMVLPEGDYSIEVIDSWEMTRKTISERANGIVHVELPGKEGMAVLATRLD